MKLFPSVFFTILSSLYADVVLAAVGDIQIPSYPMHGIPLDARQQALGNIAPVGQISSFAVLTSPSTLASGSLQDVATVGLAMESQAGFSILPGSVAYSVNRGRWGYGYAVAGQFIAQGSPEFLYQDEYGGTGAAANNIGFSNIRSHGSRNQAMAGVGYAVTNNFRVGASLGLLFGTLKKTADVTQYQDNTYGTVIGNYTQTDIKSYTALVTTISLSWDITHKLQFGFRALTPLANGATVRSTVYNGGSIVYQDPAPYLIEGHTIGADAEGGFGLAYRWNNGDISLFSMEFHDNVYFGSATSWENWEIRFGHEHHGSRIWRVGGHLSSPYVDGGTIAMVGDDNGGARSMGLTFGMQSQWRDKPMDWAVGLRQVSFNSGAYTTINMAWSVAL